MRKPIAVLAVTAILFALSSCGDESSAPGVDLAPVQIMVTITGDQVSPSGDRVEVGVGQPIELQVTADAPGEIHVHSTPEQELSYEAGTSTLTLDPIEQPSVVDVESHDLAVTIVQLEAS